MRWGMFFHRVVFSKIIHLGLCSCLLHLSRPDMLYMQQFTVMIALSNHAALHWRGSLREGGGEMKAEINEVSGTAQLPGHCPKEEDPRSLFVVRPVVIWTPAMLSVCRDWLRRSRNDTSRHNVSFIYFCQNALKLPQGAPQLSQRRTRGKSTYRGEQGSCCKWKAFWWFYLIEHICLLSKWHCKQRRTGMVSLISKLIMSDIRT